MTGVRHSHHRFPQHRDKLPGIVISGSLYLIGTDLQGLTFCSSRYDCIYQKNAMQFLKDAYKKDLKSITIVVTIHPPLQ
jgi:hypothetical protein